jgi:hypothetical protein
VKWGVTNIGETYLIYKNINLLRHTRNLVGTKIRVDEDFFMEKGGSEED